MTYEIDIAALLDEIRRYLSAVDAFRAAGCEPTWLSQKCEVTPAGSSWALLASCSSSHE